MNIIKGLDRVALVIAIISIVFGFAAGYQIYWDNKSVKIYSDDEKPPVGYIYQESFPSDPYGMSTLQTFKPYKAYAPPKWRCVLSGFFGAIIAFPVVLFGLRGITRGTRWFFLWIYEGFRDEDKK